MDINRCINKVYITKQKYYQVIGEYWNRMQCMYINHIRNQDIKQAKPTVLVTLVVFTVQLDIVLRIPVLVAYKRTLGVT